MSDVFDSELQSIYAELQGLCHDLPVLVQERDSTARLLDDLPRRFSPKEVGEVGGAPQRAWELTGLVHLSGTSEFVKFHEQKHHEQISW
jgi:hypothetical protein